MSTSPDLLALALPRLARHRLHPVAPVGTGMAEVAAGMAGVHAPDRPPAASPVPPLRLIDEEPAAGRAPSDTGELMLICRCGDVLSCSDDS